ncbi:hypothetical protein [Flavobacterium sp.]|uniref:hypothetical protein n=1 Tax=Flavobacterium sp. TaxID=239 RepID=UPI0037C06778
MTILFASDWGKHPNAIIDYQTKNQSFIRVAEIYHRMGIQNCAFHLSLLDPELQGVDPFSENLTLVEKGKIVRECKLNFWYYLREIERIPESGSMVPMMFQANRMNIALYWLFFNHVMTIVVILRQTGKTTTLSALGKYLLNFGSMNTFINLLTKSEGLKAETLNKVKALFEELPDFLNFSTKKDIFNTDEIHIKDLENKFKGNLSSSSPKQAEKVGRGFTAPTNLIDEAAFVENIAIAMGAMLMSGNFARVAAERNGNPYGTLIATTAGNIDDRDGSYIYGLVTGATLWDEKFLDLVDLTTLNKIIYTNSDSGKNSTNRPIVNITMSYRQLGYSDEWMEKTKRDNISTPENIKRDLYNQWLSGSSVSPVDKKYLEILRDNLNEYPKSDFWAPHNYLVRWYIPREEFEFRAKNGSSFIIGSDTSDGVNADDISFVVRDHVYGDVILTANFNEVNLITIADFYVSFLLTYTNSVLVIERKSSAPTIIDYIIGKLLAAGVNPFKRMYNTIVQEKEKYSREYEEIMSARLNDEALFIKYKKHIGFTTSGSGITSRSELYSTTLTMMLKFTAHITYDRKIIDQISALVVKNNRIDHPSGGHDDMVIAALLSYWLMVVGRNLSAYGINTALLFKGNNIYLEEKYRNDEDEYDRAELMAMEDEFNRLLEQFKRERNPIISMQLEAKIHKLASNFKPSNNAISVEEMLDNMSREKRLRLV